MDQLSKYLQEIKEMEYNLAVRKSLLKEISESDLEIDDKNNLYDLSRTLTEGIDRSRRKELKDNKRLAVMVDRNENGELKPRFVLITRFHPEGQLHAEENIEDISFKDAARLLEAQRSSEMEER